MSDFCPHGIYLNDENCSACIETIEKNRIAAQGKTCVCPEPPYDVTDSRLYYGVMCPTHGLFKL